MIHYFKNLFIALLGCNPYRVELDKVRREYQLTALRVKSLEEMRYEFEQKMADTYKQLAEAKSRNVAFQNLTENLRQHITDKDVELERTAADYRERLAEQSKSHAAAIEALQAQRTEEMAALSDRHERETVDRHEAFEEQMSQRDARIAALREDLDETLAKLQQVNHSVARDLLAQSLLDKTNNGLEDLYVAMQSGDPDKVLMATQYLDWSNHLVRIAQQHLMVLRRRNELMERLHFTADAEQDENVNHE